MSWSSDLQQDPAAAPHVEPTSAEPVLRQTPLHGLHRRLGAKMMPFAGYDMPLQYPAGTLKEHLNTRGAAGLFDISHLGQIAVAPNGGSLEDVALALESVLAMDAVGLEPGRVTLAMMTTPEGGIIDDAVVMNLGDRYLLVVNAACKAKDEAHLRAHLPPTCAMTIGTHGLLALQGPQAEAVLAPLAPELAAMRYLDVRPVTLLGAACLVSRTSYTGEDGFEIAVPEDRVEEVAEVLLRHPAVLPAGLGARDSLRLEAALCLIGADIDETVTPIEADLAWTVPHDRRRGSAREGGFPGASRILDEIENGPARIRVGLKPEGRTPVRAGAPLFAAERDTTPIGMVTSGGFGPSVGAPVAMGFLPSASAAPGTRVFAEVRGQRLPVVVSHGPFLPHRFKHD